MWFAGVIELTAGLLVMIGWFTKYVAFVASGEMAFAYFMVHARRGLWPILNGGELAVVYCFVFLFIAAHGARVCSLDMLLERSRSLSPLRRLRIGAF